MMKYPILLCVISLCIFSCKKNNSPTPVLDSPAYSFFPGSIGVSDLSTVFTNDGNIAIVGTTAAGSILLLKLSQSGNQLLKKEIPNNIDAACYMSGIYSLVQTNDDGYMICGSAYNAQSMLPDVCLLRLNSKGEFMWLKTYGGGGEDYGDMIIKTKDGNYLLCGTSYSFTTEPYNDIYMVKVNDGGDVIWAKSYARHEQQTPFHLLETKNGDYIVTGTDEPTGDGRVVYLLKIDANGNKLWDNTGGPVNISHWEWGYCTAECPNGDLLVCGNKDAQVLLLRTDNAGNALWKKTFATDSFFSSGVSMKLKDGNCLITGSCTRGTSSSSKCFLLKTDQTGNQLLAKNFPGTGSIYGANLLVNNSGDNILTGYQSFGPTNNNIFFTRTDADGNYK